MSDSDLECTPDFDELGNPEGDDPKADVEPGTDGPEGTGVEGADEWLNESRDCTADDLADADVDFEDEDGQDDTAAAEQGNREGDEMVSEGDDADEVAELDGDDDDIDAIGDPEGEEQIDGPVAGLDGTDAGEDPLAGGQPA